ncbi:MAG: cytochrome c family protein [Caulobacter sp.]|nr:cytochrome c family protein [Caulobacter sp.]
MRASLFIAALTLGVAVSLSACSKAPESGGSADSSPAAAPPAAAPAAPEMTDAEKQAVLAALPAPYNTGNLENGRKQFALCRSCHNITPGGPNMTGPNLYGVFGRKAGSHEGFKYSDALKNAGFVWDAEKLDSWLTNPQSFLPGNRMTFVGVKDPQKRIDLIAYLKVESGYKPPE